jgi:hypothetical protein
MLEKPMSLPPIWSVTMRVCFVSESNCGGFGPSGSTFCGFSMSSVSAPLQLGSLNTSPRLRAVRCGKLLFDLRQPNGGIWSGISGPAV